MPKIQETNYEKRMREENSLYSFELDLWNSSKSEELNLEERMRRIMEKIQ